MRRDLQAYLAAAGASNLPAWALCFELSFGSPLDAEQLRDGRSSDEPVAVNTPAGEILIRGRLDRVDRLSMDGVEGLLVVDYKTGKLPNEKDVIAGRSLQMPLYAAAAESLIGEKCVGGAYHGIGGSGKFERFFAAIATGRGSGPYKLNEAYEENLALAMETVGRFVGQMAAGRFFVMPSVKCPSYCPLRQICQYSPVRAQRKALSDGKGRGGGSGEEES
jgi:hypothetical protein